MPIAARIDPTDKQPSTPPEGTKISSNSRARPRKSSSAVQTIGSISPIYKSRPNRYNAPQHSRWSMQTRRHDHLHIQRPDDDPIAVNFDHLDVGPTGDEISAGNHVDQRVVEQGLAGRTERGRRRAPLAEQVVEHHERFALR